jgi:hypothetical protein
LDKGVKSYNKISKTFYTFGQACATSGPQAGCDPRNPIVWPSAASQVLSFVKPAISNIQRSKAVKEFLISRAPNK